MPLFYRYSKGLHYSIISPGPFTEDIWDNLFRRTVISRLDTIVVGVLGAFIYFYYSKIWTKFKYFKFILGIILIYIAQYKIKSGILYYTLYFDILAFGILLLLPLLNGFQKTYKFIALPVTYISIASYSMYLIHHSLILAPILVFGKPFSDQATIFFYSLYLVSSILISIIIYKYFEKPIMDLREKKYTF